MPFLYETHRFTQPYCSKRQKIVQLAQENDITYLALYGSYARKEQTRESDLDLLVTFEKPKGLLAWSGLNNSSVAFWE